MKPTHQPTTATATKGNAPAVRAVDIGSKNTNELDQSGMWGSPSSSPEISAATQGIRGRGGGLGTRWGEGFWHQWLKINVYWFSLLTCSVDSFGFFFFFLPPSPPLQYLSILLSIWNQTKLLSFFFCLYFFSFVCDTYNPDIKLFLYVRLLQFFRILLFFLFFFLSLLLNLIWQFLIPLILSLTFIPVCFSYSISPLCS